MSNGGRTCRNCGANIPEGERVCPSCGRLSIDSDASRLGATPVLSKMSEKPQSSEDDTIVRQTESLGAAKDDGVEPPPEEGPKPDSFYAIAPATPRPESSESSSGGTTCCNPCAILFIIIGWLVTLLSVL